MKLFLAWTIALAFVGGILCLPGMLMCVGFMVGIFTLLAILSWAFRTIEESFF